jgi:hypothetical protein
MNLNKQESMHWVSLPSGEFANVDNRHAAFVLTECGIPFWFITRDGVSFIEGLGNSRDHAKSEARRAITDFII